jgi:hypothetical protein
MRTPARAEPEPTGALPLQPAPEVNAADTVRKHQASSV